MKKMINKTVIEGVLYESTLTEEQNDKGEKHVRGSLFVETAPNNVVEVSIWENEITRAGKPNQKYGTIKQLVGANSIVSTGRETAVNLSINSAFALNDWSPDGEEIVSNLQNKNGFINIKSAAEVRPQATFQVDMLITGHRPIMKDAGDGIMEETGAIAIMGYIFDFLGRIMPVEFMVENEAGVEYFQTVAPNTFTKVWGKQVSSQETVRKVEESAFGEDMVTEYTNTTKKLVVTGTNREPYMFDTEGILTQEEVQKALADREVYLAERKSAAKAPKKSAPATNSVVNNPTVAKFDF